MAIPTIDPLPSPPQRGTQPEVFVPAADAFMAALPAFQVQTNAAIGEMNTTAATINGQAAAVATNTGIAQAAATSAATSAASAINAPGTRATSAANLTLGVGTKTVPLEQTGKEFAIGQTVSLAFTADGAKRMIGPITQIVGNTLTVVIENSGSVFGSGSTSGAGAWTVALSAPSSIPIATKEDLWAGTDNGKAVTSKTVADAEAFQTLTDAATVAWNCATQGWNASVELTANRVMGVPTNLVLGRTYTLLIKQPAGGGARTLTFPSQYDFGQAGAPTLSTAAGKIDKVRFQVIDLTGPVLDAVFKKAA